VAQVNIFKDKVREKPGKFLGVEKKYEMKGKKSIKKVKRPRKHTKIPSLLFSLHFFLSWWI
jgi:hypothetical protein